jgi:hypothetical protein
VKYGSSFDRHDNHHIDWYKYRQLSLVVFNIAESVCNVVEVVGGERLDFRASLLLILRFLSSPESSR